MVCVCLHFLCSFSGRACNFMQAVLKQIAFLYAGNEQPSLGSVRGAETSFNRFITETRCVYIMKIICCPAFIDSWMSVTPLQSQLDIIKLNKIIFCCRRLILFTVFKCLRGLKRCFWCFQMKGKKVIKWPQFRKVQFIIDWTDELTANPEWDQHGSKSLRTHATSSWWLSFYTHTCHCMLIF